ncbi:Kcnb2, partial [Symbiodinium sp. CCMP2456]
RELPWITPSVVPIDLFFFRRIFSRLYSQHGDSHGEVPVSVFQRSVVRLFRLMQMDRQADEFSADEYDVDGSGAVGWYEFVTVWRKADVSVKLSLPERIFVLMEEPTSSFLGVMASALLNVLIFLSCVCFMIATLPEMKEYPCDGCEPEQRREFQAFEYFCVGIFALEYIVRVCSAPFTRSELLHYEQFLERVTDNQANFSPSRFVRFMGFVIQPMNLIDLFVIVPFVVESSLRITTANFTVLRVLRLTRLFRLVKLGKSFEVLQIIGRVFHKSIAMFWVFAVNFSLALCFSAATIYFVEGGEWDDQMKTYMRTGHNGERSETPFLSIPHSFWWVFVTFTTVGYGDVVPETFLGKLIGASSMLVGIFVLALPISVISTTFGEVWHEWKEELRLEAQSREEDLRSVELALQIIENRTHLTIEIYDHSDRYPPELLGHVQWRTLPLDSRETVECGDDSFPIKSSDKVHAERSLGEAVVGYTWTPSDEQDVSRYSGTLEVRIRRAEGLLPSDWKKHGKRNVYALVRCWPKPPTSQRLGQDFDVTYYSRIADATLDPVWDETFEFDFDWPCDWRPQKDPPPARMSTRFQDSPALRRANSTISGASPTPSTYVARTNTVTIAEETQDLREERPAVWQVVEKQAAELRQLRQEVGTLSRAMGDLLPLLQGISGQQDVGGSIAAADLRDGGTGNSAMPQVLQHGFPAASESSIIIPDWLLELQTRLKASIKDVVATGFQVRIYMREPAPCGILCVPNHSTCCTSSSGRTDCASELPH